MNTDRDRAQGEWVGERQRDKHRNKERDISRDREGHS